MTIKEIFEKSTEPLTLEMFEKLAKESGAKFTDLSEGNYVSKDKHDNELAGRDGQITQLNDTIKQRDKDLKDLKSQLKEAGTDSEKLTELENQLGNLQTQYKSDTDNYKAQLAKQAYEFAVKEFANGKKFSSNAAKRDFVNSMIAKELKMDGDKILGADDFVTSYSADNADAFLVESEAPAEQKPKPSFSQQVSPNTSNTQQQNNGDVFGFNFIGVRPRPDNK
jgi:hypothetical protein